MVDLHDVMHGYEVPMIIASGAILLIGWALHWYSEKLNCHDTCSHGPCESKKNKVHTLLIVATVLFAVNVTVYMVFHRGVDAIGVEALHEHDHVHDNLGHEEEASDAHDGHDH